MTHWGRAVFASQCRIKASRLLYGGAREFIKGVVVVVGWRLTAAMKALS
jgi:hypothetical protein